MFSKFERAIHSLASIRFSTLWVVFLAPSLHALDYEFINGVEMSALQLFLHQPLRVGLELEGHQSIYERVKASVKFMISYV